MFNQLLADFAADVQLTQVFCDSTEGRGVSTKLGVAADSLTFFDAGILVMQKLGGSEEDDIYQRRGLEVRAIGRIDKVGCRDAPRG